MNDRNAPMRFPLPVMVLSGAIGLSLLLGWLVPLPWFGRPLSDILALFGAMAILAGIWLIAAAIRVMNRARTTVRPDRAANHLVSTGPFRLSRNPIYLGMGSIIFGLGALMGETWFVPVGLAACFLIQKLAIEPEERHLDALFGKRYRDYRKSVRRWI